MTKPSAPFSPERRRLLQLLLKEKGVCASDLKLAPAITRRPENDRAPLSLNQEGLWFIDHLDPGRANYNIPGAVRLKGRLDVKALERSLGEIVRRHKVLRTTFHMRGDGTPFQVVAPYQPFHLPVIDLATLTEASREAEALRLATEESGKPFDLGCGPLFRAFLIRLSDQEHALIFNVHHIVCDGWSMGVFTRELTALYEAFSQGKPSPLPELTIQFSDFAAWEREWLKEEVLDSHLSFWRKHLSGAPPTVRLPTDHLRPSAPSYHGRHHTIRFSKTLSEALRSLSQREGVTLYMTCLAAFKTLLHWYSGQEDLIVGTAIANRDRSELEDLIGYFATVLPFRTKLAGNPTFRELLRRVQAVTLGVSAHHLPLATIVKELHPERHASRNPFFQIEFTLLTPDRNPAVYGYAVAAAIETVEFSGLTMTPLEVEGGISRFDLAVIVWDMPDGIRGTAEYSTDLFEPETIARMIRRFEFMLNQVIAESDAKLSRFLERLDEEDQRERLHREKALKVAMHQRLKNIRNRSSVANS